MFIVKLVIITFILLETSNILAMYFMPDTKYANAMGIFRAWEKSKQDPEIHNLVQYLVNWVAGTKFIFILLLIMILFHGDDNLLILTAITMGLAISLFYWRLFPLIRQMDETGNIEPKNYSYKLGWMIGMFIVTFLGAVLLVKLNIF